MLVAPSGFANVSSNDGGDVTWHLGFVTPDDRYAGVEQSDGAAKGFLDAHVAGAAVPTVSLAIVNRKLELPPLCASGWLTCHETTHSPFGKGFGTVTLSDTPSNPTAGLPTASGDPLQAT